MGTSYDDKVVGIKHRMVAAGKRTGAIVPRYRVARVDQKIYEPLVHIRRAGGDGRIPCASACSAFRAVVTDPDDAGGRSGSE